MNEILAKLKYGPNSFEVLEKGNHVICAVSGKKIPLDKLTYWNVDLQEAYFSPKEVQIRFEELKK
ncbi:MAG: DUF2093 domain-containing protein [Pelagibacteraceae bacterium]|jgi:hypothetical protein|nr:DUF2093 domain-containing protein [Pelagibacteraceae bacterium]